MFTRYYNQHLLHFTLSNEVYYKIVLDPVKSFETETTKLENESLLFYKTSTICKLFDEEVLDTSILKIKEYDELGLIESSNKESLELDNQEEIEAGMYFFYDTTFMCYPNMFNTKLRRLNLYSDLPVTNLNLKTRTWYYSTDYNFRLGTDEFENDLEERISFLPNLNTYKQSSISNFFSSIMVDTPRCFKKSQSLYKPIFNMPHLKLLHILMRHGYKEQIFSRIFKILIVNKLYWSPLISTERVNTWVSLLPFFSNSTIVWEEMYDTFLIDKIPFNDLLKTVNYGYLTHPQALDISTFWTTILEKYKPIFMFKVQKVDKITRKNSRGKSGKYVILWKYVPVYRRIYAVLRWLIQDIAFQKAYKFETRFIKTLDLITTSPQKSTIIRNRNFTHNFVFKNFKKTLLQTLQTVS